MSHFFLDITDAQITLASDTEQVRSPGAAMEVDGTLVFGTAPFEALKLRPLEVQTDFWRQLSTAPLTTALAHARHSADLVYEHLTFLFAEVGTVSDLSLIAPASLSQAQLELLLGVLKALDKSPSSVIDRALLSYVDAEESGIHLDLQWRQLVVSELERDPSRVSVIKSTTLPGLGLLDLLEHCIEHCADACVEQTRFDPRRSADSEQALLNAMPQVLSALKESAEVSVPMGAYTFNVARSGLTAVGERVMAAVTAGNRALSVDGLLADLPGMVYDRKVDSDRLFRNARRVLDARPPDAPLARIRCSDIAAPLAPAPDRGNTQRDPAVQEAEPPRANAPTTAATPVASPTHVLLGATAYAIGSGASAVEGFGIIVRDGVVCIAESHRDSVNVLSVESSHEDLRHSCRLYRHDGEEALLICVEP